MAVVQNQGASLWSRNRLKKTRVTGQTPAICLGCLWQEADCKTHTQTDKVRISRTGLTIRSPGARVLGMGSGNFVIHLQRLGDLGAVSDTFTNLLLLVSRCPLSGSLLNGAVSRAWIEPLLRLVRR